jgi:hypothetical protein
MKQKKKFFEFHDCILCDNYREETIMHLFFECSFRKSFWWAIEFEWNSDMHIHDKIQEAKIRYLHGFLYGDTHHRMLELVGPKNDDIFNKNDQDVNRRMARFKYLFSLTMKRAKASLRDGMQSWFDTL